jgi:hypothetical protein
VWPGERRYLLASARLAAYTRELGEEPDIIGTYRGAELLGTRYLAPFPYFMHAANSFQVLSADFVSTEDGTGIVHMSPAYGDDDKATADKAGIVPVTPVDSKGRFDQTVPDYANQHVWCGDDRAPTSDKRWSLSRWSWSCTSTKSPQHSGGSVAGSNNTGAPSQDGYPGCHGEPASRSIPGAVLAGKVVTARPQRSHVPKST